MSNKIAEYRIGVGYDVNESQLKKIPTSLDKITQSLDRVTKLEIQADASQVSKASQEAQKALVYVKTHADDVKKALATAFQSGTNTYNVQKFAKALKSTGITLEELSNNLIQLGPEGELAFKRLLNASTQAYQMAQKTETVFSKLSETMANTIRWKIASSAIDTVTGSIQRAWGYAEKLDTSLNNIRIVTGKSAEEMERFAQKANKAAKNLSASTTSYTNAALIYYQQGLSEDDVKARTDVTIKAANVTGQSAAEVSEQLTAVWNGYKVVAEEAELYVDKLAAVAATTAADLEELSDGMSKVASAANAMGVDVDQLSAQLATIISVTRQDASVVGTALKTIYSRMGDLKVDGVDEFGVSLGDVSGQLRQMGIEVLDQQGNLRDMGNVIEEVAAKWGTWTDAQQQAAAVAIAGKRQYNNLIALFENWDMYESALVTSETAEGTLEKQQKTYKESIKAMLQEISTASEGVMGEIFDTESIKYASELLVGLLKHVEHLVKALGGLKNILPLVLGLFLKSGKGQKLFSDLIATAGKTVIDFWNLVKGPDKTAAKNLKEVYEVTKKLNPELAESKKYAQQFADLYRKGLISDEDYAKLKARNDGIQRLYEKESELKIAEARANQIGGGGSQIAAIRREAQTQIEAGVDPEDLLPTQNEAYQAYVTKVKEDLAIVNSLIGELEEAQDDLLYTVADSTTDDIEEATKALKKAKAELKELNIGATDSVEGIEREQKEILHGRAMQIENRHEGSEKAALLESYVSGKGSLREYDDIAQLMRITDEEGDERVGIARDAERYKELEMKKQALLAVQGAESDLSIAQRQKNKEVTELKTEGGGNLQALGSEKQIEKTTAAISKQKGVLDKLQKTATSLTKEQKATVAAYVKELDKIQVELPKVAKDENERLALLEKHKNLSINIGNLTEELSEKDKKIKEESLKLAEKEAQGQSDFIENQNDIKKLVEEEKQALANVGLQQYTSALANAASQAMIFASGINMVTDAIEGLNEGTVNGWEAVTGILTGVVTSVTSVLSTVRSVQQMMLAHTQMTAAGMKVAGQSAQLAFGWISAVMTAIVAIVSVIGNIVNAIGKQESALEKANRALEKANEEAKEAQENYKKTREAYSGLIGEIEDYRGAQTALSKLRVGTEEWRDAVTDLNIQVMDLIQKYPQLMQYLNIDEKTGAYSIQEKGWEIVRKELENNIAFAQRFANITQLQVYRKEKDKIIEKERNDAGGASLIGQVSPTEYANMLAKYGSDPKYKENISNAIKEYYSYYMKGDGMYYYTDPEERNKQDQESDRIDNQTKEALGISSTNTMIDALAAANYGRAYAGQSEEELTKNIEKVTNEIVQSLDESFEVLNENTESIRKANDLLWLNYINSKNISKDPDTYKKISTTDTFSKLWNPETYQNSLRNQLDTWLDTGEGTSNKDLTLGMTGKQGAGDWWIGLGTLGISHAFGTKGTGFFSGADEDTEGAQRWTVEAAKKMGYSIVASDVDLSKVNDVNQADLGTVNLEGRKISWRQFLDLYIDHIEKTRREEFLKPIEEGIDRYASSGENVKQAYFDTYQVIGSDGVTRNVSLSADEILNTDTTYGEVQSFSEKYKGQQNYDAVVSKWNDIYNTLYNSETGPLKDASKIVSGLTYGEATTQLNQLSHLINEDDKNAYVQLFNSLAGYGSDVYKQAIAAWENIDITDISSVNVFRSYLQDLGVDILSLGDDWDSFIKRVSNGVGRWLQDIQTVKKELQLINKISKEISTGDIISEEEYAQLRQIAPEVASMFIRGPEGLIALTSGENIANVAKNAGGFNTLNGVATKYEEITKVAKEGTAGEVNLTKDDLVTADQIFAYTNSHKGTIPMAMALGILPTDYTKAEAIWNQQSAAAATGSEDAIQWFRNLILRVNQAKLDAQNGEYSLNAAREYYATSVADSWSEAQSQIVNGSETETEIEKNKREESNNKIAQYWANTFLAELSLNTTVEKIKDAFKVDSDIEAVNKLQEQVIAVRKTEIDYLTKINKEIEKQESLAENLYGTAALDAYKQIIVDRGTAAGIAGTEATNADTAYKNQFELFKAQYGYFDSIQSIQNWQATFDKDSDEWKAAEFLIDLYQESIDKSIAASEASYEATNAQIDALKYQRQLIEDLNEAIKNLQEFSIEFSKTGMSMFEDALASQDILLGIVSANAAQNSANALVSELGEANWASLMATAKGQEYLSETLSSAEEAIRNVKEEAINIYNAYLQAQDELLEIYDKEIERISKINNLLKTSVDLAKIAGVNTQQYSSGIITNLTNSLNTAKTQMSNFAAEFAKLNDQNSTAEMRDAVASNYAAAAENVAKTTQELLQAVADDFNARLADGFKQHFGQSLENISDEWAREVAKDDRYLDSVNSAYAMDTFNRNIQKSIDETDNIVAQRKLIEMRNKQEQKLNEILTARGKLSQAELDRANAEYELVLKQIALEEAQSTANKMKLVRDAQGNYSYQYVSDLDEIARAEEELAAAQNNLYNIDKDRTKTLVSDYYSTWSEANQKIAEAWAAGDEDRVAKLQEYYFGEDGLLKTIQHELEITGENLDALGLSATSGNGWLTAFERISGSLDQNSYLVLAEEVSKSFAEYTREGGIMDTIQNSINSLLGTEGLPAVVTTLNTVSYNLQGTVKELSDATTLALQKLPGLTTDVANLVSSVQNYMKEYVDTLKTGLINKVDITATDVTINGTNVTIAGLSFKTSSTEDATVSTESSEQDIN